jgi:hypothetical protein
LGLLVPVGSERLKQWRWVGMQAAAVLLLVMGILTLRSTEGSDFIYFQF